MGSAGIATAQQGNNREITMSNTAYLTGTTKPMAFPEGTEGGGWVFYVNKKGKPGTSEKIVTDTPSLTLAVSPGEEYDVSMGRLSKDEDTILGTLANVAFQVPEDGTGEVLIAVADTLSVNFPDAAIG